MEILLYLKMEFLLNLLRTSHFGYHLCHSAVREFVIKSMFVKSDLAKRMMFDTSYRICSDYDMCYKIYKKGYEFLFVDIVISHYDVTGVSCNNQC